MKKILYLFSLILITSMVFAQAPNRPNVSPSSNPSPNKVETPKDDFQDTQEWYQIHFDKPIEKIEEIFYDKEKTPIEGEISRDRKTVILKSYSKKARVKVRLIFEGTGGVVESVTKSSCFIDPVIPL